MMSSEMVEANSYLHRIGFRYRFDRTEGLQNSLGREGGEKSPYLLCSTSPFTCVVSRNEWCTVVKISRKYAKKKHSVRPIL